jgi:WD40 repeat protein
MSVSCSKDNKFFFSGSRDKTLNLWNVSTGECIRTFYGDSDYVNSVSLSYDNKFFIRGSIDKTLK